LSVPLEKNFSALPSSYTLINSVFGLNVVFLPIISSVLMRVLDEVNSFIPK
jgi:hypothetical protein